MAVSRDIMATWLRPRQVIRRHLSIGRREDRALVFLILACGLIFVAQLPRLRRDSFEAEQLYQAFLQGTAPAGLVVDEPAPFQAMAGITFFAMMVGWPLLAYLVAAISHGLARLAGGRGSAYSARLALFWTMLATAPAWLFFGLVQGFVGPGPAETAVGALLLLVFFAIWGMTLFEAETAPESEAGG